MNNIIVNDVSKITDIKFELVEYDNYFVKKYCPINKNSDIPLHKFWLIAEKCKVTNITNNKTGTGEITVVFSNKSKYLNDKLELENKIRSHFKKKTHCDTDIITTNKFIYDNSTVFFNSNDIEEKYVIQLGDEFDMIVELAFSELYTKHINFIWKVVQLKKIKLIDLKISLFTKYAINQQSENKALIHQENKPHFVPHVNDLHAKKEEMQKINNITQYQPQIKLLPQIRPVSIAFTPALLQGALSKLKKPKSNSDEINHIPIENDNIVTQLGNLKHVETKVTNIIDVFKKEQYEKIKNNYEILQKIIIDMKNIFDIMNNDILIGLQLLKKMDNKIIYNGISNNYQNCKNTSI